MKSAHTFNSEGGTPQQLLHSICYCLLCDGQSSVWESTPLQQHSLPKCLLCASGYTIWAPVTPRISAVSKQKWRLKHIRSSIHKKYSSCIEVVTMSTDPSWPPCVYYHPGTAAVPPTSPRYCRGNNSLGRTATKLW